jgi:hypothetical protein
MDLQNIEIVKMGEDCMGNVQWAPVEKGRLTSITGDLYNNPQAAEDGLFDYLRLICDCGSGQEKWALHDGHGIFLCYVCEQCEKEKRSKYRADIFEAYDADEPIDPDW